MGRPDWSNEDDVVAWFESASDDELQDAANGETVSWSECEVYVVSNGATAGRSVTSYRLITGDAGSEVALPQKNEALTATPA